MDHRIITVNLVKRDFIGISKHLIIFNNGKVKSNIRNISIITKNAILKTALSLLFIAFLSYTSYLVFFERIQLICKVHHPRVSKLMKRLETPEEIQKWREERRKNFPTKENIQKKVFISMKSNDP